jgi:hypothetical protein
VLNCCVLWLGNLKFILETPPLSINITVSFSNSMSLNLFNFRFVQKHKRSRAQDDIHSTKDTSLATEETCSDIYEISV